MASSSSSRFTQIVGPSALLALAVGLSGCAHTYTVKVDALNNPRLAAGVSYRIEPKDTFNAERDPNYPAATALVRTALATKGMYEADDPKEAEVVVTVDYGVGSRRLKLDTNPALETASSVDAYRATSNNMRGSGNSNAIPQEPATAYPNANQVPPQTTRLVRVYEKYFEISARQSEQTTPHGRTPAELWRVTATVEDESASVAPSLPILAGVAAEKIGTTTNNKESIRVSEHDAAILVVQNGI